MTVGFWHWFYRTEGEEKGPEYIVVQQAMMQSIGALVLVSVWQLCDLKTLRCCISIHITVP